MPGHGHERQQDDDRDSARIVVEQQSEESLVPGNGGRRDKNADENKPAQEKVVCRLAHRPAGECYGALAASRARKSSMAAAVNGPT